MIRLPRLPVYITAGFLFLWLLWYTLEPRRTAYSCRTVSSCLGLGRHHHAFATNDSLPFSESEQLLRDGTIRYERRQADAEILILVLSRDANSWSSDFRSTQRSPYDFADLVASTHLDLSKTALAVMTGSPEEFRTIKEATSQLPLARVSIYHRQDEERFIDYDDRHNPQVQLARRSSLALLRNYLMLSALQDESHIIWIDADVVEMSPSVVQTMIGHSNDKPEAGIITSLCWQNEMINYDKNAWKLDSPQLLGVVGDEYRDAATQQLARERLMVPDLIKGTDGNALVPLDSVGGTILYIRASLVKQGLSFPHFNVVGTTWNQMGWIGVETEGLCFMAKGMKGGGCFVLGGDHHVRHTDWG